MKRTIGIIMVALLCINLAYAIGIGVAPATATYNDILRGNEYIKQINVQNPNDEPMVVSLEVENYSEWFSYPTQWEIPAKNYDTKINLVLNVPTEVELGEYHTIGKVRQVVDSSGTMSFAVGVNFNIDISLTDEIIRIGEVDYILSNDVLKGNDLIVRSVCDNKGNVPINPIISANLYKSGVLVSTESKEYNVNVGQSMQIPLNFITDELAAGQYKIEAKVELDGEVLESRTIYVKILDVRIDEIEYINSDFVVIASSYYGTMPVDLDISIDNGDNIHQSISVSGVGNEYIINHPLDYGVYTGELKGYLFSALVDTIPFGFTLEEPVTDSDGDGVDDGDDLCPDTSEGKEVDVDGCSSIQFCRGVEITIKNRNDCIYADWKDNEGRKPSDCYAVMDFDFEANDICRAEGGSWYTCYKANRYYQCVESSAN